MTISAKVQQKFFSAASAVPEALIRLPPTVVANYAVMAASQPGRTMRASRPRRRTNLWTVEEHDRFLRGLEQFPQGPWKEIAAIVGSKTTRQTMTHAQKYREKIERRQRSAATNGAREAVKQRKPIVNEDPTHRHRQTNGQCAQDVFTLDCASIDQALQDASNPLDVAADFFAPSLFDQDLYLLIEDLSTVAPAPMTLSYAF